MFKSFNYLCLATAAAVGMSSIASGAITIDTVTVGNSGNTADSTTRGAVGYDYQIGKYEVTATQYAAFLNAVAKTDTNGLFQGDMANTGGSGITQGGSSGTYTYSVDSAHQSRPVTNMTLWSALRFANWMQNGQPSGLQDASTTETGSYDLTAGVFDSNSPNYRSTPRTPGAQWVLPSVDEFYKAAYYDASNSTYHSFPFATGADGNYTAGSDTTEVTNPGKNANFKTGLAYVDPTYNTTPVGQFSLSSSSYGTFDQGGNLQEWVSRTDTPTFHSLVGGHFSAESYGMYKTDALYSSDITAGNAGYAGGAQGFRLALVPEPGSITLLGIGAAGLLLKRRRSAKAVMG